MRWGAILLLCVGLCLAEPFVGSRRIALGLEQAGPISYSEFFLRFLGEMRFTIASYLWLNTEIYHHELGLEEISSNIGTQDAKKVGEIIGICRLVTRLDPNFVQAYDIGSWRLIHGLGRFKEGIAFLREGIANNPDNPELYSDLGGFYFFDMKDCGDAEPNLEKAYALSGKDEMARKNNLRMLAACYERDGNNAKAIGAWREFLRLYPGDATAEIHIRKLTEHR